jgi:hypothetical protein
LIVVLPVAVWFAASVQEWRSGRRVFPWSAYALCGSSTATALPESVRIGLYEEFPVPWRLGKLELVDFPVSLAVAAPSRAEFLRLEEEILRTYPSVREVYFWPLLSQEEGYYPGVWSSVEGVRRLAGEAEGLPTLWDSEVPLGWEELSLKDWWENRRFLGFWLRQREEPVQIWRSYQWMGLNSLFLRIVGIHYDPLDYPEVTLQLDLYMRDSGMPDEELARILRCGVERYGERFVPSFGVLNDMEGPEHIFVPVATLRRNLRLAREAGVSEVWLFGVNGLNEEYLTALQEELPLEAFSEQ